MYVAALQCPWNGFLLNRSGGRPSQLVACLNQFFTNSQGGESHQTTLAGFQKTTCFRNIVPRKMLVETMNNCRNEGMTIAEARELIGLPEHRIQLKIDNWREKKRQESGGSSSNLGGHSATSQDRRSGSRDHGRHIHVYVFVCLYTYVTFVIFFMDYPPIGIMFDSFVLIDR